MTKTKSQINLKNHGASAPQIFTNLVFEISLFFVIWDLLIGTYFINALQTKITLKISCITIQ